MTLADALLHGSVGAAGAASMEILVLWGRWRQYGRLRIKRNLSSPLFWTLTTGMLAASGFIAWAMTANVPAAFPTQVALVGIAARSIVRQIVNSAAPKEPLKLGSDETIRLTWREYFS